MSDNVILTVIAGSGNAHAKKALLLLGQTCQLGTTITQAQNLPDTAGWNPSPGQVIADLFKVLANAQIGVVFPMANVRGAIDIGEEVTYYSIPYAGVGNVVFCWHVTADLHDLCQVWVNSMEVLRYNTSGSNYAFRCPAASPEVVPFMEAYLNAGSRPEGAE